jgi:hypothetical protein
MSQSINITMEDIQRVVDKISKEVICETGNLRAQTVYVRLLNAFYAFMEKHDEKDGRLIVTSFRFGTAATRERWDFAEAYLDFRLSVYGKSVEELKEMFKAIKGKSEIELTNKAYLNILINRNDKEIIDKFKSSMSSKSEEELRALASTTGDDFETAEKQRAATAFLQNVEVNKFRAESNAKNDEELANLRNAIATDVLSSRKSAVIDDILRDRNKKRDEEKRLARTIAIFKQSEDTLRKIRSEYKNAKKKKDKEAIASKLQWKIDVAKGKMAQSLLDGKESEITSKQIEEMEARLRLVKVAFFGIKDGFGYEFESFYETTSVPDVCSGFPTLNHRIFTIGDSSVDVLAVDHDLTDVECVLIAKQLSKDEGIGEMKVMEMLGREDLKWKSDDEDGEEDEADSGEDESEE